MGRLTKVWSWITLIWSDLKLIFGWLGLVALIITLPTLTLNAFAGKLLDDAKTVGEVIVLTWPLTISATILFMALMRGSLQRASGAERFWALLALVIVPYLVALLFGATDAVDRRLATPGSSWVQFLHPGHAMALAGDILLYYFSVHGLWRMFSSLVCGLFLAWAYEHVLLPRARQLRDEMTASDRPTPAP